jgi:hypothetical protein
LKYEDWFVLCVNTVVEKGGGLNPIGVKLTLTTTCSVRSRMFIEKWDTSDNSPIGATCFALTERQVSRREVVR